ncbi:macrolide family glycosyltransferase [Rhodococcus sp. HNM0569]|uniref:macrolide family glycosyltransferase n=1 Tax=Rhodococcus sp. HNM0569 TaxID=2716340 RepID=UPI00146CE894|nr:macrolide family glycosyltransferase [Rhodococcus sp. HNM0569]NLU82338.1 glycosyl transferase [Rhodococcus sp. HNM0569]
MPAHIAVVSIPAPGHVNPSLEVVRALVARGYRVTYANDPSMRAVVERTGAQLRPYASTLPKVNHAAAAEESEGVEDAEKADWGSDAIDALTLFQTEYESMLPQLRALYENDRPDLFLYDIAGMPARILAEQWGIPIVQISPTYVAWEGYEADMAEFTRSMRADPRGAALHERQQQFLRNEGIDADADSFLGRPPRAVVLIAKSMQPNADRVDESVYTFVGPALPEHRDADGDWTPPEGERALLVSLGTAFTADAGFYRRCIDAFGPMDGWRLILQIGRTVDPDDLGELPTNVEVHRWVPQFDILRHADAFVTHAGMGGSSEGLATGTPMICAPQAVDQFGNADALVEAGVAVRVDSETVTPQELREALDHITSESVRTRSRELADEMRAAGGAAAAVAVIESALEQADWAAAKIAGGR